MGLRGPMIIVGYGKDYFGKSMPNENTLDANAIDYPNDDSSEDYPEDVYSKPSTWIGGVVDLKWDRFNRVWSSPGTIYLGTVIQGSASANSGKVSVGGSLTVDVKSPLGTVESGTSVIIGYDSRQNEWLIVAAACTS
jgi:hypothetical protein